MAKASIPQSDYAISWQNRFYRFANSLPFPAFVFYFLLFLFFVFINHLAPWLDGNLPWGEFDIRQLRFHLWFVVVFFAGDYFISLAEKTLGKFRPSLQVSDKEYQRLSYSFVNLPWLHGLVITLVAGLFFPFLGQFGETYQLQGIAFFVFMASGLFMFSLVYAFIYFLLRSLLLVSQLFSRVTKVNIFNLDALIAFSGYTSRVGIFLVVALLLSYWTNVVFSEEPRLGGFIFFAAMNLTTAVIAFVYPLLGIHERLQIEKEKAKAENNNRLEIAQNKLHRLVDSNAKEFVEIKNAITGLLELRHELDRISTWPWNTATLTTFVSALFLPVFIWLIQQFLSRLLQ